MELHISLAAEKLWSVAGFPITNALLTTYLVMALLVVLSVMATRKLTMVPGNAQLVAEAIVGGLYDFFGAIAGRHIKQFFPLIASLFIFILIANWVGLLPGVGTVGFNRTEAAEVSATEPSVAESEAVVPVDTHAETETEAAAEGVVAETPVASEEGHSNTVFVPLLRAATADLNTTLALAVIAVVAMQYFGFRNLGGHYISRFISFKGPIDFSVGILEFVSDLSKIISFAFRLFGNIFAGEVLLAVVAFLIPFFVPLPFLLMELFVGVVQALVFSMLTTAFLNMAVSHGEGEHAQNESHAQA